MQFRVSYDATTKVVTAAVFILFLTIAASSGSPVAAGFCALVLLAAYAWSPTGYEIANGNVVIHRLIGNVEIPVSGIREIRIATRDDLRSSMRIFGSGGLFGYYGLFRNSKLGDSNWYVTDRSRAIVLAGDSGIAIVSPEDQTGFMAALGARRAVATGHDWSTVGQHSGGHSWAIAACLIAGAATLCAYFLYSPGPPRYTLTKTALEIHDRNYPVTLAASNVDVGNIRVVDFDKDKDWKPVIRTNGFGMAHYHTGWFRVTNGQKVRMYRANSKRVVLLPPKGDGAPVLLETKDPDKFVADVQHEWGQEGVTASGGSSLIVMPPKPMRSTSLCVTAASLRLAVSPTRCFMCVGTAKSEVTRPALVCASIAYDASFGSISTISPLRSVASISPVMPAMEI